MRVLCLDDDNHSPSFHDECTSSWHDALPFIKYLSKARTYDYTVRCVCILDICSNEYLERCFDVVQFGGKGYSYEEYQEAFNALWEISSNDIAM